MVQLMCSMVLIIFGYNFVFRASEATGALRGNALMHLCTPDQIHMNQVYFDDHKKTCFMTGKSIGCIKKQRQQYV